MSIKHFGIMLDGTIEDNKLNENNFSILTDKLANKYPHYKEVYSWRQIQNMLIYHYNMSYYEKLNNEEFNSFLNNFVSKNNLEEIKDLDEVNKITGIYLMVLDDYKQIYIGQAVDIKDRIKRHWRRQLEFNKISQGYMWESKIAIDSFKALDTTRIFIYMTDKTKLNEVEMKMIDSADNKYLTNLISPLFLDTDFEATQLIRFFEEGVLDHLVSSSVGWYLGIDKSFLSNASEISHAYRITSYLDSDAFFHKIYKHTRIDLYELNKESANKIYITILTRNRKKSFTNKLLIEVKKDIFSEKDKIELKEYANNNREKYQYIYCLSLTGLVERYFSYIDKWIKVHEEV